MTNHKASYWRYTGNHTEGKDCSRNNSYGYPLDLIQWMAYHRPEGTRVSGSKSNGCYGFGSEIHVSAPKEVWESEWVKMAKYEGDYRQFDRIETSPDGVFGVIFDGNEDHYTELFFKSEDENELEMVQKGYAPTQYDMDGDRLWVPCKAVAQD